jgi:hypothetical protein
MLPKIYRCWIVYGYSWRVAWPLIILWLASLACTVLLVYSDSLLPVAATQDPEVARLRSLFYDAVTTFYSTHIATNLFSTGMTTLFCFVI